MRRIIVLTILLALALAAPAAAELPRTVGVGLIRATKTVGPYGDVGSASYDGTLGPVTGNNLTIGEAGTLLLFDAPLTLLLPGPLAADQASNCNYGFRYASCVIPPVSYPGGYPSGCTARVTGNLGADHITLHREYEYYGYDDCAFISFTVVTKQGNDVIDVEDAYPTYVSCGPGYDRVRMDAGDTTAGDCEIRTG